jgi:hypothetical protein
LLEARILTSWQSDLEIRSVNEFTDFGLAKDYDAVVKIERGGRSHQIAIEYERTPKTRERYPDLRRLVERERRVNCVLYLMPALSPAGVRGTVIRVLRDASLFRAGR